MNEIKLNEIDDLTLNIKDLRNKLQSVERFLKSVTVGMAVLFVVMIILMLKIAIL